MATVLTVLALIPVFIGVLITGDFTQKIYKPPSLHVVYVVFRNRYLLIISSVILWLIGVIVHLTLAPTNPTWLIITAGLIGMQAIMGFFMSPYIAFPQVRQPQWVDANDIAPYLAPEEPVLGIEINGDARAFPVKWLERPHIVKEVIGGEPVTMTYCMLSNLGIAFGSEQNGEPLDLLASVQWENNLVLYDTRHNRMIQQIDGTITYGDDPGQSLVQYPTRRMTWGAWQQLYPETQVFYHPPQNPIDRLVRKLLTQQVGIPTLEQPEPWFRTIPYFDKRLPNKTQIIGVRQNRMARAYTLDQAYENGAINDTLGGRPLVVLADAQRGIVDTFDRVVAGKALTFEFTDNRQYFVDHQTCSLWNIKGEAVAGSLAGEQLKRIPHASHVFWFIWTNFNPQTELSAVYPIDLRQAA